VGCAGGRSDGRRANEGGAPERSNFVSDELLISASAMCLAPLSPMLLSRRGGRDAGENEHRRSEWDAREDGAMGGERMRVAHNRRVQLRQRRVAHQRVGDVLGPVVTDVVV
jgi:hypothetical protein